MKALTQADRRFNQGFALALAEMNRQVRQPAAVTQVMRDAGMTVAELKKSDVDSYDWEEIQSCLPKQRSSK